jgi:hypothetical protein
MWKDIEEECERRSKGEVRKNIEGRRMRKMWEKTDGRRVCGRRSRNKINEERECGRISKEDSSGRRLKEEEWKNVEEEECGED